MQTNKKKFKFHSDPGHSWLAVKIADIEAVGLTVSDFTHYSYVNGLTAYLEEDVDTHTFLDAYVKTFGKEPVLIDRINRHRSSKIRSYVSIARLPGYYPRAVAWVLPGGDAVTQ